MVAALPAPNSLSPQVTTAPSKGETIRLGLLDLPQPLLHMFAVPADNGSPHESLEVAGGSSTALVPGCRLGLCWIMPWRNFVSLGMQHKLLTSGGQLGDCGRQAAVRSQRASDCAEALSSLMGVSGVTDLPGVRSRPSSRPSARGCHCKAPGAPLRRGRYKL